MKQWIRSLLALAMFMTGLFCGTVAQAQDLHPAFSGTFTLPYQVTWGGKVLPPGDYRITIKSTASPMIAMIRTAAGDAVTNVVSGSVDPEKGLGSKLFISEKDGKLVVNSLALADLRIVLIYDRKLAREPVRVARVKYSVPVLYAQK